MVINTARFTVVRGEPIVHAPAFVRDPLAAPHEQGYKSVVRIRSDRDEALASLGLEFQRLASVLYRVEQIAEAYGLQGEFDEKLAAVGLRRAEHLKLAAQ